MNELLRKEVAKISNLGRQNLYHTSLISAFTTYTVEEMINFGNFENFFDQVEIDNAYEELHGGHSWEYWLDHGIKEAYFKVYMRFFEILENGDESEFEGDIPW